MPAKQIPYDFILEYLYPLEIEIKSMFGMKAIYYGDKILLMLRMAEKNPQANGIWVALAKGERENLKKEIPALQTVASYEKGKSDTEWQLLKPGNDSFESIAIKVCDLIKKQNARIGRIPKQVIRKKK